MSDARAPADVFIQWKGTRVCLDFHCYKCDTFSHLDADFAYYVKCPTCGQIYQMPSVVPLLAVESAAGNVEECDRNEISSLSSTSWKPMGAREVKFLGE